MSPIELIEILVLGLSVGMVSAFLGVGGGVLLVPLLPWITSLSHHQAIATSLFTIFFVSSLNTFLFHLQGRVVWKIAQIVGPSTIVFSFLAGWYATSLNESWLKAFLLFILFLVIVRTIPAHSLSLIFSKFQGLQKFSQRKGPLFLLGMVAGATSGFTGIGSGIIVTPYLLIAKIVKSDEVTPTTNAIMAFTTFAGALSYIWSSTLGPENSDIFNYVKWDVGLLIFLGAFTTSMVGRRYQHKVSDSVRRWFLVAMMMILVTRVTWDLFAGG